MEGHFEESAIDCDKLLMLPGCLLQIVRIQGMITPKDLKRLMPADLHNRAMVDARARPIRPRRMRQIVEAEISHG
jgi:hypothetical protein